MSESYITDLSAESVRVLLSKPIMQELADGVLIRAPTVSDIRLASKSACTDEDRELQLFAALTGIAVIDLEQFLLSDYQRLQHGYFLMVSGRPEKKEAGDV